MISGEKLSRKSCYPRQQRNPDIKRKKGKNILYALYAFSEKILNRCLENETKEFRILHGPDGEASYCERPVAAGAVIEKESLSHFANNKFKRAKDTCEFKVYTYPKKSVKGFLDNEWMG